MESFSGLKTCVDRCIRLDGGTAPVSFNAPRSPPPHDYVAAQMNGSNELRTSAAPGARIAATSGFIDAAKADLVRTILHSQ